jgi:hypothetical protein
MKSPKQDSAGFRGDSSFRRHEQAEKENGMIELFPEYAGLMDPTRSYRTNSFRRVT